LKLSGARLDLAPLFPADKSTSLIVKPLNGNDAFDVSITSLFGDFVSSFDVIYLFF
jgi:hypothetical protein